MSDLKQRINDDVKASMRRKDKKRLATLRLVTAAIKQIEVDERIELDDAQVLAVLDKMAKQHRDSIEQFEKATRDDLVQKEQSELAIILEFLPKALNDDEVSTMIEEAITESGATDIKDMGKVMGILKPKVQGRADMGKISGLVKQKLG
jgi:uncharacterized protein YqeY